jgi:hypothetical protein
MNKTEERREKGRQKGREEEKEEEEKSGRRRSEDKRGRTVYPHYILPCHTTEILKY